MIAKEAKVFWNEMDMRQRIDRELKKHEEKIMKKNGTHSSKF